MMLDLDHCKGLRAGSQCIFQGRAHHPGRWRNGVDSTRRVVIGSSRCPHIHGARIAAILCRTRQALTPVRCLG